MIIIKYGHLNSWEEEQLATELKEFLESKKILAVDVEVKPNDTMGAVGKKQ